jgi:hypothetical protein
MEVGKDTVLRCPFSLGGATRAVKTVLLIAMIAVSVVATGAETPSLDEYQVKAAFLYNFAKFVEWPAYALPDASTSITLCILGEDPFGITLDQTINGKIINGRQLVIKRLKESYSGKLEDCHILFISLSEARRLRPLLEVLKNASVLTVSEIEWFAKEGGIIHLTLEEGKVRFEVNVAAAERARLKISSRLLRLAKVIRE